MELIHSPDGVYQLIRPSTRDEFARDMGALAHFLREAAQEATTNQKGPPSNTVSKRSPNEEEVREVLRRLARREGPPQDEGLFHQARRPQASAQAAPHGAGKKSPALGHVAGIAEAWAEAQPATRIAPAQRVANEFIRLAGELYPHQLNALHWQSLVSRWKQRHSQGTVWSYTSYLRQLARTIGTVSNQPNLHKDVPRVKPAHPRTTIASPAQISALLANAQPWMRVFLTLAISLGLRHSEILDVRPAGYDAAAGVVKFRAKGGETQQMPATEEVAAIFANAPEGDPLTPLLEIYRGRPVTKDSIRRQWAKLKRQSGITNLVPHDLRRTVAVSTYELTKDLRIVWQILRHKDLSTTARYIEHRDPTQLREILAQLWRPKGDTVQ